MSSVNKLNVKLLREKGEEKYLSKYSTLGKIFLDKQNATDDYYIDGFIDYLYKLSAEMKLPGLKTAGVDKDDFTNICNETDSKNNPVRFTPDNFMQALEERYF